MIIFVVKGNMSEKELKHLREYLHEAYSGIVVIVNDIDDIKIDRE